MTELVQLLVAGVALGALYALVALGFVVVYRATKVINFAQGALVMLGAYLAYALHQQVGIGFYAAVGLAMAGCAAVGFLVEGLVLRRMVGQPVVAVIMTTIGLSIVAEQLVTWTWGFDHLPLGAPWGLARLEVAGVFVAVTDVVRIGVGALFLGAFFALFRHSRMGLAMRATASDQEAALAQGIRVRTVFAASWAVAGCTAAVAGVLLVAGPRGLDPSVHVVALAAFPAVILGGLDSPGGAVAGGVVVGVVEVLTAGYGPRFLPESVGANFHTVMPYLVLVAILLLRPFGLFGTREVTRI